MLYSYNRGQCEREGRHGFISIELKNEQFSLSIGDS